VDVWRNYTPAICALTGRNRKDANAHALGIQLDTILVGRVTTPSPPHNPPQIHTHFTHQTKPNHSNNTIFLRFTGYTLLEHVYVANGTIFLVSDHPSTFPPTQSMASMGKELVKVVDREWAGRVFGGEMGMGMPRWAGSF
jgi:hypothetical protein